MIKFHHRFTINLIQPTIPRYNLSLHPIHPNSPSSPHFILETSIIKGSFPQRMKFFLSLSFSPFRAFSINFFPSTGRPSNIIQLRFVRWFRGLSTSKRSFISQLVVARKAEMTSRVSTRPVVATASRCLSYRGKRVHKRVSWRQPEAHRIDNISWERGRGRGEREREEEYAGQWGRGTRFYRVKRALWWLTLALVEGQVLDREDECLETIPGQIIGLLLANGGWFERSLKWIVVGYGGDVDALGECTMLRNLDHCCEIIILQWNGISRWWNRISR